MSRKTIAICGVCLAAALALTCPAGTCLAAGGVLQEQLSVDMQDMVGQLEAAVKAHPSDAGLRMALGEAWFMAGEADTRSINDSSAGARPMNEGFTRAEENFRAALKLDPREYLAHYYIALIRMQTGRMAEAAEELYTALALKKDDYRIYQKLHSAYTTMGLHPQAAKVMARAISIFPESFDALRRRSITAMIQAEHALALEYSARAIRISDDAGLRVLRADAYMATSKPAGAIRECEAALRLAPESAEALGCMAKAHAMAGNQAEARKFAERALALDPSSKRAREALSGLDQPALAPVPAPAPAPR